MTPDGEAVARRWPEDTQGFGYMKVDGISEKTRGRAAEEHNALADWALERDEAAKAAENRIAQLNSDLGFMEAHHDTEHARAEAAEAENAKLRVALQIIAGHRQPLDNLMSNREIAEAGLTAAQERK